MTDFVLKYSTTKGDIMINEEKQVCYNMQVYNDFVDFPIAMTNIKDFEFDKLLSHPNPKVRAFPFIVITKCQYINYILINYYFYFSCYN